MSTLYCPCCGQQQLDLLGGDDDGDCFGCRNCRHVTIVTLLPTEYTQMVEDGPRMIFDIAEQCFNGLAFRSDKGVSL